jgi:hypothetical protein
MSNPSHQAADEKKPTADECAAPEFLSELRTRISTKPLPYQYRVESRARESLWEVFAHARTAMKNHPGCEKFAQRTTEMLNLDLRPVIAKWHRAYKEGRLNSRDGSNEFRADLEAVQNKLRKFADELHQMAYRTRREDSLTPFPSDASDRFCRPAIRRSGKFAHRRPSCRFQN